MALPDSLHPKQWKKPRSGLTWKLGDFSLWNGQSPTHERPRRLSELTPSVITATMSVRSRTRAMVSGEIKEEPIRRRHPRGQAGREARAQEDRGRAMPLFSESAGASSLSQEPPQTARMVMRPLGARPEASWPIRSMLDSSCVALQRTCFHEPRGCQARRTRRIESHDPRGATPRRCRAPRLLGAQLPPRCWPTG